MYAVLPYAIVATLLYLCGGIWQACVLARASHPHPVIVRILGLLAACMHGIVIYATVYNGHGSLNLGILEALSIVCWVMTILLLVASMLAPLIAVSSVLLPLSAISLIALITLPASIDYNQYPPGVLAHISGSILAFSLFAIAAAQACLIALQYRALKSRRLRGIVQALPPLTQMERLLSALISLGMVFLTISIVSGAIFDEGFSSHYLTPKAFLSLAAWGIFGGLLWFRHVQGWRGRRAVRWTLIGVAMVLLAFISSRLLLITV